jgi:hypothetical protein
MKIRFLHTIFAVAATVTPASANTLYFDGPISLALATVPVTGSAEIGTPPPSIGTKATVCPV